MFHSFVQSALDILKWKIMRLKLLISQSEFSVSRKFTLRYRFVISELKISRVDCITKLSFDLCMTELFLFLTTITAKYEIKANGYTFRKSYSAIL